ncbi:MAG: Crp/Fnr family transcriptional regulator [Oscillospiraceae bacterium]|nr:Crp/Fnr family transcriptional regulator [Oscillospiraceae bacterium]
MTGKKIAEILKATFLFEGVPTDEILGFVREFSCKEKSYPKGEIIFSPEKFERVLGVVLSGRIAVTKGRLSVSELTSGNLFGAAALFNDEPEYASTLTAKTAASVLYFSQEAILTLINRDERIRMNYIRYLSARIRFLSEKVDTLGEISSEKRLSRFLLKNADDKGYVSGVSFSEIAGRLGIGRASLYRELAKLEEAGVIRKDKSGVEILKPSKLSRE